MSHLQLTNQFHSFGAILVYHVTASCLRFTGSVGSNPAHPLPPRRRSVYGTGSGAAASASWRATTTTSCAPASTRARTWWCRPRSTRRSASGTSPVRAAAAECVASCVKRYVKQFWDYKPVGEDARKFGVHLFLLVGPKLILIFWRDRSLVFVWFFFICLNKVRLFC